MAFTRYGFESQRDRPQLATYHDAKNSYDREEALAH